MLTRRGLSATITFTVLLALSLLPEIVEYFREPHACGEAYFRKDFLAPLGYDFFLSKTGNREIRYRRVRVITLTRGVEPDSIMDNVCLQRGFLAALIQRLQENGVAMVVLDKYFSAKSCPPGDSGTESLLYAVRHRTVPIVVGRGTDVLTSAELANSKDREASCLALAPSLILEAGESNVPLRFGLTRLDQDNRKIPLDWPVYLNHEQLGRVVQFPSLSRVSAEIEDPELSGEQTFEQLLRSSSHPFASFVPQEEMKPYSALSMLCADSARDKLEWKNCPPPERGLLAPLRSKIVVIGNSDPKGGDYSHDSVIGEVPGVILQANYIESLLDDRFFKPLGEELSIVFSIGWLLFLTALFWRSQSPERVAALAVLVLLICFVATYVTALVSRYFLAPWLQGSSLVAIMVKYIEAKGHTVGRNVSKPSPTQ